MRFTQSFMDEIRDRVPISDVVGTRVAWDKRKTNTTRGDYWACCPFHGEKSPSFHCEDKKGRYYCFGCGESGDHFRFLTQLDGMAFPEAVERVAAMAGVAMPAYDPEAQKRDEQRATLVDVMEMATAWFEQNLQTRVGTDARAYLRGRGLSDATIAKFRLGFAPDSRSALKEFLASKGASKEQIEATGMVVHGEDIAVSYDRFRDRIIFPIEDNQGRIIAFGGRAMKADAPAKYLNSPETELFHKSNVLFNFKNARAAAAKAKNDPVAQTLIAVEGYMDVIALDQAGVQNAVAPLGTALTERQLEMIWRATPEPVLCFDGDGAGLRAANRSLDLALPELKAGRTVRFALLPDGQDPDDLVKAHGKEAFVAVINNAKSFSDMLWLRETGGRTFDTPERRAQLEETLREATNQIADPAVRRHYNQEMRERTQAWFGGAQNAGRGTGHSRQQTGRYGGAGARGKRLAVTDRLTGSSLVSGRGMSQLPLREAAIVSAILCHPDLLEQHFDLFCTLDLDSQALRQLRSAILQAYGERPVRNREQLMDCAPLKNHRSTVDAVDRAVARARLWVVTGEAALDDAREGFRQAVELHRSASALSRELKAAEDALGNNPTEQNLARLLDIRREMANVQGLEALVEGFGVSSGRASKSF
ncbi:MAG: DNA primase [Ahrensia sp.]